MKWISNLFRKKEPVLDYKERIVEYIYIPTKTAEQFEEYYRGYQEGYEAGYLESERSVSNTEKKSPFYNAEKGIRAIQVLDGLRDYLVGNQR